MTPEEANEFMRKKNIKKKQDQERIRIAKKNGHPIMIDLVFEERMNGKENKSLAKQIELIYKGLRHLA